MKDQKRNRAELLILLLIVIIVSIFFMSCETTKTKIEYIEVEPPDVPIDSVFNVSTTEDWEYAIEKISTQGDGHEYLINITENSVIIYGSQAFGEMTFGTVKNISVTIEGQNNNLVPLAYFLQINQFQNIIINNLYLNLQPNLGEINPAVTVRGEESMLTLTGNTRVLGPVNVGFEVSGGGTFNLIENTTLSNFTEAVIVNQGGLFYMRDNASILGYIHAVTINNYGGFYMYGGVISNNNVSPSINTRGQGNVINIQVGGFFGMYGGTISNNVLAHNLLRRSIINVDGGTFQMINGSISNNNVNENNQQAIIHIEGWGEFYMYGGTIFSNTSFAVISVADGHFNWTGGIIYGSEETGVVSELANIGRTLNVFPGYNYHVRNLLPHVDGYEYYTYYSYPWPLPGNTLIKIYQYDYDTSINEIEFVKE